MKPQTRIRVPDSREMTCRHQIQQHPAPVAADTALPADAPSYTDDASDVFTSETGGDADPFGNTSDAAA